MTLKENIQAVIDSNFSETKEKIKETALQEILKLIDDNYPERSEYVFETDKFMVVMDEELIHVIRNNSSIRVTIDRVSPFTDFRW